MLRVDRMPARPVRSVMWWLFLQRTDMNTISLPGNHLSHNAPHGKRWPQARRVTRGS